MEKPLILIDKDGNKIEDLDKFLSEQKFYLTDNEGNKIDDLEKFFADNPELKGNFNSLELYGNPFEYLKFRLLNGNIKTGIEHFYYSKLKEIDSQNHNENFKEYLVKEKGIINLLKLELNAQLHLKSDLESEIKFAIARLEQLQNIIDFTLKKLETIKPKNNKILAFNNDLEGGLDGIEIILEGINKLLFDESTIEQWEKVLKGKVLENPIVIKNSVKMEEFKHFIDQLKTEYQILKGRNYTELERNKVFLWNGEILTQKKITNYFKMKTDGLKPDIDKILSALI